MPRGARGVSRWIVVGAILATGVALPLPWAHADSPLGGGPVEAPADVVGAIETATDQTSGNLADLAPGVLDEPGSVGSPSTVGDRVAAATSAVGEAAATVPDEVSTDHGRAIEKTAAVAASAVSGSEPIVAATTSAATDAISTARDTVSGATGENAIPSATGGVGHVASAVTGTVRDTTSTVTGTVRDTTSTVTGTVRDTTSTVTGATSAAIGPSPTDITVGMDGTRAASSVPDPSPIDVTAALGSIHFADPPGNSVSPTLESTISSSSGEQRSPSWSPDGIVGRREGMDGWVPVVLSVREQIAQPIEGNGCPVPDDVICSITVGVSDPGSLADVTAAVIRYLAITGFGAMLPVLIGLALLTAGASAVSGARRRTVADTGRSAALVRERTLRPKDAWAYR
jgi:hypothetical protein